MKPHPKIIDRIIDAVRQHRTFCVVGHIRPDGDCIGSQLGLTLALRNEGKKVLCWNEDRVPQKYEFLDPDHVLHQPKPGCEFDCVISTDAASFERLGTVGPCVAHRNLFINIDHHESNTRFGDLNWVSGPRTLDGRTHLPPVENRQVAHHQGRLPTACSPPYRPTPALFNMPRLALAPTTLRANWSRGANLAKICHEVYQSYPSPARVCSATSTATSA